MWGGCFGVSVGIQGCRGVRGLLGAGRDSRYSGARRGMGIIGIGAPRGYRGCRRAVLGALGV